jgi:rhodanese-related sulfurtransferase
MFEFLKSKNTEVIHVNDLDKHMGSINLIDIREPYEYKTGTMKGAKNIPMGILLNNPEKFLTTDQTYYIMCQSGGRSKNACNVLTKSGYQVINVVGGMGAYVGTNRQ